MRVIDVDDIVEYLESNLDIWKHPESLDWGIQKIKNSNIFIVEPVKHGQWLLLDECSNAGVYCSVCHKKVYNEHYANVKVKSKFCPNCGTMMDEEFRIV